jgi:C4-dicarboxylate-specific signal transduction histidine kinase
MSATVAHEINNPLSIIKMVSSNAKGKWSVPNLNSDEVSTAFLRISKTADRIHKIVRSLRSLGRDASSDPLEVVLLSHVFEDAVSLLEHKIKLKGVELRFKPEDLPYNVCIRHVLFTQVLVNLVSNAVDAIEALPDRWIDVKVEEKDGFTKIRVIDSGHGIPDEVADKLMESIFTTKGVGKGTGLGLRLCRSIIEGHGGQLYLDRSMTNTTFVISIPSTTAQSAAA